VLGLGDALSHVVGVALLEPVDERCGVGAPLELDGREAREDRLDYRGVVEQCVRRRVRFDLGGDHERGHAHTVSRRTTAWRRRRSGHRLQSPWIARHTRVPAPGANAPNASLDQRHALPPTHTATASSHGRKRCNASSGSEGSAR
jgi:hypothetical protein